MFPNTSNSSRVVFSPQDMISNVKKILDQKQQFQYYFFLIHGNIQYFFLGYFNFLTKYINIDPWTEHFWKSNKQLGSLALSSFLSIFHLPLTICKS